MKIEFSFLRSRFGRRIFSLFVVCSLLPILTLSCLFFIGVRGELKEQASTRLHRTAKSAAQALVVKLGALGSELAILAAMIPDSDSTARNLRHSQGFTTVRMASSRSGTELLLDQGGEPLRLDDRSLRHLSQARPLLIVDDSSSPRAWMVLASNGAGARERFLVGEVNLALLKGAYEESSEDRMAVLDAERRLLSSNLIDPPSDLFRGRIEASRGSGNSGEFSWNPGDEPHQAAFWEVPLGFLYGSPPWTVVVSEPQARTHAPLQSFTRVFLLVALGALLLVSLLSTALIRRNTVPLQRLKSATEEIAGRNFDARVEIATGDELQDLGTSFNSMASTLASQFKTLRTIGEIDRAVLSSLDTKGIIGTVFGRFPHVFPGVAIGVMMFQPRQYGSARTFWIADSAKSLARVKNARVNAEEVEQLLESRHHVELDRKRPLPEYTRPVVGDLRGRVRVFPLKTKEGLSGGVIMAYPSDVRPTGEDGDRARQLADQLAVALSNARLVEEHKELHWGTLRALARTVDAKSPWTAGHSERVTTLALELARRLGLGKGELSVIHRGGLLHDIGKIGVPAAILDKPGRLTSEEFDKVRQHPVIGERILEPISQYADILPILRHHHEWYDGSGYPDGISGERIRYDVRILSVADVFDALVSDRPYRAGMPRERAVSIIREGTGTQFDPEIVKAFTKFVDEDDRQEKAVNPTPPSPASNQAAAALRSASEGEESRGHLRL